jgi:alkylation response protein AidB-like acyl-CoA dehydrogenase
LCGLAQAMLDRVAAHVTDRHQFGRPIAAFQTVRHRLTEVVVALASARAALDAAWTTGEPLLADAAKALAGRAGLLAARHCLQVTGAIGFTEEYGLAAQTRRVHALDALYGRADALQARIGGTLLADRSVPRLHPLP